MLVLVHWCEGIRSEKEGSGTDVTSGEVKDNCHAARGGPMDLKGAFYKSLTGVLSEVLRWWLEVRKDQNSLCGGGGRWKYGCGTMGRCSFRLLDKREQCCFRHKAGLIG